MELRKTVRITDAQIHLWTNGLAPPHHWRAPYRIEDALRDMKEAGIDSVLNHPPNWDPDSNSYAARAAEQHPERFATLGWFHLDDAADESCIDELMKMPGMRGMRFILPLPGTVALLNAGRLEWLWSAANERALPVGLFVMPQQIGIVGGIAARYPRMRLLIDHMGVPPFAKLPQAGEFVDALLGLARHPNVAVKASAVPGMATDPYPFASTHDVLRRTFDAFGAERMFWGTDFTRMHCSWRECVDLFVKELDWLKGAELEAVMGGALRGWIGWN